MAVDRIVRLRRRGFLWDVRWTELPKVWVERTLSNDPTQTDIFDEARVDQAVEDVSRITVGVAGWRYGSKDGFAFSSV